MIKAWRGQKEPRNWFAVLHFVSNSSDGRILYMNRRLRIVETSNIVYLCTSSSTICLPPNPCNRSSKLLPWSLHWLGWRFLPYHEYRAFFMNIMPQYHYIYQWPEGPWRPYGRSLFFTISINSSPMYLSTATKLLFGIRKRNWWLWQEDQVVLEALLFEASQKRA